MGALWKENELKLLKQLWTNEWDYDVIQSKLPGRSFLSMRCKASRLGLYRPKFNDEVMKVSFVIDQIATNYLIEYWGLN